jgi:hypothetical protein
MHLRGRNHRGTRYAIVMALPALALLWSLAAGGRYPVAADDPALPPAAPMQDAGTPVRLTIATINVDAAIEAVGLTPDGAMATPQTPEDTAWYQLGPRPGDPGNAVIVGHVDSAAGDAVFWDLHTLTPGSLIAVVSDDGVTHQFVMRDVERYPLGSAPLTAIFGAGDGIHLTLITCDADTPFDRASGTYAGHVVIYADAAP